MYICQDRGNLTHDEVDYFSFGEFHKINETKHKCFTKCFFDEFGIIKDGIFQRDLAKKIITAFVGEKKATIITIDCKNIIFKNDCETSYEIFKCYFGED